MVLGINVWAFGVVGYYANIAECNEEDLSNLDRMTRKIMTMNLYLQHRRDPAKLEPHRKESGSRLMVGVGVTITSKCKVLSGLLREYPGSNSKNCAEG